MQEYIYTHIPFVRQHHIQNSGQWLCVMETQEDEIKKNIGKVYC